MTNNRNAARRIRAQAVVLDHVNRRRRGNSEFLAHFVQVLHLQSLAEGNWVAVVRVEGLNQQLFVVEQEPNELALKVDTFTRQHVSRFY